jgi:hypothetical protein
MHDEALSVTGAARRHFDGCTACQDRYTAMGEEAALTQGLFELPEINLDPHQALAKLQPRLVKADSQKSFLDPISRLLAWSPGPARPVGLTLAAVVLTVAVAAYPMSLLAARLQVLNQATSIVPVPVAYSDLQDLPKLDTFGTFQATKPSGAEAASAAQALAKTGLHVPVPANPPAGVARYAVLDSGHAAFTFNAAKAQASADLSGKPLPPMPTGMDGSTVTVAYGPAVGVVYGGSIAGLAGVATASSASADPTQATIDAAKQLPALILLVAKAPTVTSTGVTAKQLENYLLKQPGLSSGLAKEIKAIGDPTTQLPIPVPDDYGTSQQVTVQGGQGLFIGDNTGIAGAVIWIKNGLINVVAGPFSSSEAIAVANSLS